MYTSSAVFRCISQALAQLNLTHPVSLKLTQIVFLEINHTIDLPYTHVGYVF